MDKKTSELRRGWTTGANAAAASLLALQGFLHGIAKIKKEKNLSVAINLPHHQGVPFTALDMWQKNNHTLVSIKKDAGDDPDITHGIILTAELIPLAAPAPLTLLAGDGVGTVTRMGLPIKVGDPAISTAPRQYITDNFVKEWRLHRHESLPLGFQLKFHLENGKELAQKTLNPRLGIVDGLSILGTTGVVIPYSCSAWIDSIHRGIDVAIAYQQNIIGGATGKTSEEVLQEKYRLPDLAMIDMGDFYFAMMKYLKKKKYQGRIIIAGGLGKLTKLAQGHGDLHHQRSQADMVKLANWYGHDSEMILSAQSVAEAFAHLPPQEKNKLAGVIIHHCQKTTKENFPELDCDFMLVDRLGNILAESKNP